MREIELLRECRDLLEEVDKLISQLGSFEMDKTEFRVDEKEQLLILKKMYLHIKMHMNFYMNIC